MSFSKSNRQASHPPEPAPTALAVSIDRLNRESAMELCKTNPDLAAATLMALVARNTAALPGTAFVRRGDVTLRKHVIGVRVTESEKHVVKIPGSDRYDFTILGLRRLNEVAGLNIIKPERVIVEGVDHMNPCIVTDPKTTQPVVVYCRALCVGYTPWGALNATDVMVRLDLNLYLIEAIQGKMKRIDGDPSRIGFYGGSDEKPEARGWKFFPIHSLADIGLWVSLSAIEVQETLRDHTSRVKFIDRLAQSFAERNALKAHPTIPKTVNVQNGQAVVPITGWTTDFEREDLDRLRELIEGDKLEEFKDRSGVRIKVEKDRDIIDVEADAVINTEDDELRAQQVSERSESGERSEESDRSSPPPDDPLTAAAQKYAELCDFKNRSFAKHVMAECKIEHLEEATPDQLKEFIAKADSSIKGA